MKLQAFVVGQHGVEVFPALFVGGVEGSQVNGHQFPVVLFQQQIHRLVERGVVNCLGQFVHHALLVLDAKFAEEFGEHVLVLLEEPAADQVAGVFL